MDRSGGVNRIVVVGGGTAGWLAACRLAAAFPPGGDRAIAVTLIESPDVPTVGVGEGTWPTMRGTLVNIGLDEATFLTAADASFKQGSRFLGWRDGSAGDAYLHPFTAPDADPRDAVAAWTVMGAGQGAYADAVSPQGRACALHLAPRTPAMPPYAGALNYAYHLDAGRFAALLMRHATGRLGVRLIRDHVTAVRRADDGDITAVDTRDHGAVAGDLFLDCTGHRALLIGEADGAGFLDRSNELFNDRALAVQLPVAADSPVASQTDATAHAAGWIWDIGLAHRRGVGCVYSSAHMDDAAAARVLAGYAGRDDLSPRRLTFRSGHRSRFWVGNCLAIGLSAGFLEPLEASAIVMIELSLDALIDDLPRTRAGMDARARRFDALFRYRWDRIVDFLKLHYLLSARTEPYWRDHRDLATASPRLAELLDLWRERAPTPADFPMTDEIFSAASHAYVLYGMGFAPPPPTAARAATGRPVLARAAERARVLTGSLPTNRAYLGSPRQAAAAL